MLGMIDMHCHLIPGVDDGASTKRDVREMLQMEYESGVRAILLTPHYWRGKFEPTEKLVMNRANYVAKEIADMGLDMKLYLGCEYHANPEMLEDLHNEKRFRICGGRYVLVEFSPYHPYQKIYKWIWELVQSGFSPIVAHIERYPQVVKDLAQVKELIEIGALIQVDAGAIVGEDGFQIKRISRKLLKKRYIHLIGSDAHDGNGRCPNLDLCEAYVTKKTGEEYARELFVENPKIILKEECKIGDKT